MDYVNISKEELIQENRTLRSQLAQMQGREMISLNIMTNEFIPQNTPYTIWPELYCRFSPDLKFTFVNEAFADFLNRNEEIIGQEIFPMFDNKYHDKINNLLHNLSPDKPVASFEYTWTNADSKLRYRRWKLQALFDQNNSPIEYIAVGRDISEHKEVEELIRYRLKIEHAMAKASKLLVDSDEADINEILKIMGEAIAINRVYIFEFYEDLGKMNNTYEWYSANHTSVFRYLLNLDTEVFSWGIRQFMQGDNIVIADRNVLPPEACSEKKFMEEQGIYAALLVPITGINGKLLGFIGFNDTEQSRFWKDEDIKYLNMLTEMLGAYWERKKMEEELRQSRDELEKRVIERTAELVLLNEKLQQEVAERQQAEAELILSETRYRAIVEDQSELVIRFLPDGTITFVNEAYCRYFGKKAKELIGKNAIPNVYAADQNQVIAKLNSLSFDYLEDTYTLRALREDGIICWQEWTGRAIVKDQKIIEIQAVGRDVHERILAEEALQRSEANFRKLAETSPALIYVYKEEHFLYVNSTFETITSYPKNRLLNMNALELVHPDYRKLVRQNAYTRQQGEKVPPYELMMISQSGQEIWGYLYADTIDYEGEAAILGMIVDITERKKMEEDLLQASKLDSLGILAGGIAHDFNNILTVISGNISLAKMIIDTDNEVMEVLNEVEKAAFQARDLTQQLLTFSKGGAPIKETASIQELLRESASFVLRGSNVSCNYSIADDLWPVSIDKGQINQVINNLIINADQAMPDGGSIELSALNISSGFEYPPSLKPANYIKITIKDSGIGIAEKHLPKIFDPYFTTKQKGHGLGLATCYSIIKKHDGDISIISKPGNGTLVNIYLPAFPDQLVKVQNLPSEALSGQGKILIMDDEAVVRETLGKMLNRLGYTTGYAADGLNAIHMYQSAKLGNEPYDAVLMDLTIAGGMGGKEAVKKFLEFDPKAKVIVSSGYSNDPVMAEYEKYGFCGVLPKPYEIKAVNKILYDMLVKQEAG